MSSMLARAAVYAGRNFFGTRAGSAFAGISAAATAAAAGSTVAFADASEQSYIMLKPVRFTDLAFLIGASKPCRQICMLTSRLNLLRPQQDAVQRGLIGEIIKRFEARGFKLVAMKLVQPTVEMAQVTFCKRSLVVLAIRRRGAAD
jgi:hypothetical protein